MKKFTSIFLVIIFLILGCLEYSSLSYAKSNEGQSSNNSNIYAHYMMGIIYDRQGEFQKAIEEYKQALEYATDKVPIYIKIGRNYLKLNKTDEAKSYINKAIKLSPEDIETHSLLALLYTKESEYGKAASEYKKVIEISPENKIALASLADIYVLEGKNKQAIEIYKELIKKEELPVLYFNLGLIYVNTKETDEAIKCFKKTIELESKFLATYLALGLVYEMDKQPEKAISCYNEALKIDPLSIDFYKQLGRLYHQEGKLKEAEEQYKFILELYPNNTGSYINLTYFYLETEQYKRCIDLLKKAIQLNVKHKDKLYLLLGSSYQKAKMPDKAEEAYRQAIELNPESDLAHFYLGAYYEYHNRRKEAEAQFEKAIEINPDNADALNYLGYMYAEDGKNLDKAIEFLNKALEIEPENGAYVDSLGWAYYKKGNIDKALSLIKKASGLIEDPIVYDHLGDIYFKMSHKEEARRAWLKSLEIKPGQEKIKNKIERLNLE